MQTIDQTYFKMQTIDQTYFKMQTIDQSCFSKQLIDQTCFETRTIDQTCLNPRQLTRRACRFKHSTRRLMFTLIHSTRLVCRHTYLTSYLWNNTCFALNRHMVCLTLKFLSSWTNVSYLGTSNTCLPPGCDIINYVFVVDNSL